MTVLAPNGTTVCTATLTAGQGSCAIPYIDWAWAGTLQLTASYSGDDTFAASVSDPRTLTIAKDPTTATVLCRRRQLHRFRFCGQDLRITR